jgi:hypothetical protein
MPLYDVEISRTITCTVTVEAPAPEQAYERTNSRDFELPPRDEWTGSKDWEYRIFDQDGNEVGEADRNGFSES